MCTPLDANFQLALVFMNDPALPSNLTEPAMFARGSHKTVRVEAHAGACAGAGICFLSVADGLVDLIVRPKS